MMELTLPASLVLRLISALTVHRHHEIGGLLVGEHLGGSRFALVDLSVQVSGGTSAHFVRDPVQHQAFLDDFFRRTGNDYQRYNYLGEWHSHIRAPAVPSAEDVATMQAIIATPEVNSDLGVLIVVRLDGSTHLDLSATLFRSEAPPEPIALIIHQTETPTSVDDDA